MSDDAAETRDEADAAAPSSPWQPGQPPHAEILRRLEVMRADRDARHARPAAPRSTATFAEISARIVAAQEALPVQHCVTCGEPFRHHRPGRCWDCTAAARRHP